MSGYFRSLMHYAIQWMVWRVGILLLLRGFGLVSNLLLTRLIAPGAFGLLALVHIGSLFLTVLFDYGLSASVIQNRRGDEPIFLNTVWAIQIALGIAIWICYCLAAQPAALFYNQSELLWLLPVLGLGKAIAGFTSTAPLTFGRHMQFRQLTVFEFCTGTLQTIAMLIWAWLSPTVWALAGGTIIGAICRVIWSHRLLPDRPNRFAWDWGSIKSITSFSQWIWLLGMVGFFQADGWMLSYLSTPETSRIYLIATKCLAPIATLWGVQLFSMEVIFPFFARQPDLPREVLRVKMLRFRQWAVTFFGVALIITASFGDVLSSTLFSTDSSVGATISVLSLGLFPLVLADTTKPFLWAIARPKYFALGQFLRSLIIGIGVLFGFRWSSLIGVAWAIAFSHLAYYAIVAYGLRREGLTTLRQDLQATGIFLGLLACVLLGRMALGMGLPIVPL